MFRISVFKTCFFIDLNYFQRNNSENTEKYRKYLLKSVIIYKNENALKGGCNQYDDECTSNN